MYVDYKFQSVGECIAIRMTCYVSHFTSSLVNFCVITAMVLHRYRKFKAQDIDGFSKHTTRYLVVAICIGVIAMSGIAWEIKEVLLISPGECFSGSLQPMKCTSILRSCSNAVVTVSIVSIVITVSCTCISLTTQKLKQLIQQADARANTILQMRRCTNTSRIQATLYLFFFFTFNWVPYGLSRFYIFLKPTFQQFQTVTICFHVVSTILFTLIPAIYYKMDGGFQRFVKDELRKAHIVSNDDPRP